MSVTNYEINFCQKVTSKIPFISNLKKPASASKLGQAIGPLWDFCAPISIIVGLIPVIPYPPKNNR